MRDDEHMVTHHNGTEVQSATSGEVVRADMHPLEYRDGGVIEIRDLLGNRHIYGHLGSVLVKMGDNVRQGEVIATVFTPDVVPA